MKESKSDMGWAGVVQTFLCCVRGPFDPYTLPVIVISEGYWKMV